MEKTKLRTPPSRVQRTKPPTKRTPPPTTTAVVSQLDPPATPLHDERTYACLLRRFGNQKALSDGRRVHSFISRHGRDRDTLLANPLLHMYGKCGSVEDARIVFSRIHRRDTLSWNLMIEAYAKNGHHVEALELYKRMKMEGVKANKFTFLPVIAASASLRDLREGKHIHECIAASGFGSDIAVMTALVNMYGKCGSLIDARTVFDQMHPRDVMLWTAMIAAYAQNGCGKEAFQLFGKMELEGLKPDRITLLSILEACARLEFLPNGRAIHDRVIASGLETDVAVGTALVNMYNKCECLKDAQAVFDKIDKKDALLWTAIVAAYAQNGYAKEALDLFRQMTMQGMKPNKITFLSTLDACKSLASLEIGRAIHECISASKFNTDVTVQTALVNMYSKCGSLQDACAVFNKMHKRDVVSWTAMIAAYAQNGHCKEALKMFGQMELEGVKPDIVTFVSILDACANSASFENGRAVHKCIVASGLESDVAVRRALVNMYGKCGILKDARAVFDKVREPDVILWTSMIAAYAQNDHVEEAFELFSEMELDGLNPNSITFLCILTMCSHAGFLVTGLQYFVYMSGNYSIRPSEEHYVCMIDLLGRAGYLDEAEELIINTPIQPSSVAWTTLLGACRVHGNVEQGACAAEHVFELNPENASPYVSLSNIYAAAGRWDDVGKVREVLRKGTEDDSRWGWTEPLVHA